MAARGVAAKAEVTKRIAEAFGDQYLGEYDKKIYLSMKEGGEIVQVAITLTCPKVAIETGATVSHDFSEKEEPSAKTQVNAEITVDERANIEKLMARLGL